MRLVQLLGERQQGVCLLGLNPGPGVCPDHGQRALLNQRPQVRMPQMLGHAPPFSMDFAVAAAIECGHEALPRCSEFTMIAIESVFLGFTSPSPGKVFYEALSHAKAINIFPSNVVDKPMIFEDLYLAF